MRFLKRLILLVFIGLSSMTVVAQSTGAEIQNMLETRDLEIKDVLGPEGTEYTEDQKDRLKTMINDVIDFESCSQAARQQCTTTSTEQQRQ